MSAARTLARAFRYLAPFRRRAAAKGLLLLLSILPLILVPWPAKLVLDNVIEGAPIVSESFPAFVRPAAAWLEGAPPGAMLAWILVGQLALLVLVGAFGAGARESDDTDAYLSSGHDTQTRTENDANAGFSLAGGLLGWADFRYTLRLTQDLNHHYRARLFERIQSLPMRFFDDERIGDAVYRVMIDTPSITNACYRILLTPIGAPAVIAVSAFGLAATFGSHPALMWSALALAPIALGASLPFAGALRRRSLASRGAGSTTTSTAEEGLAQVLAVQSLGAGGRERSRFDRDSWSSFGAYRATVRSGMAAFLVGLVPGSAVAGYAFFHSANLVIEGSLSRGDFLVVFAYFVQAAIAAVSLGTLWFDLQGSAAGLERAFALMDLPSEADLPGAQTLPPIRGGIRFENASYRHADGTLAVDGVGFEMRVGEMTALVGPAGAGKTTLAHLVPRYLEPTAGRVLADGLDLAAVTRESLRAQVSYVFQETVLFDGSVADNIRLGAPQASDEAVRRAARIARADGFVEALPEGYATRVGRAGSQLSVGQRQRVAIARALVRETPVLILDEPTSALDPDTEQAFVASLREACRDRLVLVIAHRLSTIRAADRIVFLDAGRIVEQGTHEQLMARPGGAYRRFAELQDQRAA